MAIAFDSALATVTFASPASPTAQAFNNVAGTFLIVGVGSRPGGDQVTACSYAGTSMTLVAKFNSGAATTWIYVFKLANPATGSNNISVTHSGSADLRITAASYTGAADVEANITGTTLAATAWTQAITTTTNNDWVAAFVMNDVTDNTATAPAVMRSLVVNNDPGLLDSNAAQSPPGSYSIGGGIVGGGPSNYGYIVFAIAPPSTATTTVSRLPLLHVG